MGSVLLPPENKTNALHRVWEVSSVSHGHTSLLPGDTAGLPPLPQEPPQGAKAPSPPRRGAALLLGARLLSRFRSQESARAGQGPGRSPHPQVRREQSTAF